MFEIRGRPFFRSFQVAAGIQQGGSVRQLARFREATRSAARYGPCPTRSPTSQRLTHCVAAGTGHSVTVTLKNENNWVALDRVESWTWTQVHTAQAVANTVSVTTSDLLVVSYFLFQINKLFVCLVWLDFLLGRNDFPYLVRKGNHFPYLGSMMARIRDDSETVKYIFDSDTVRCIQYQVANLSATHCKLLRQPDILSFFFFFLTLST